MRTADFHFELPPELIAQHPVAERDASRLLVFNRATQQVEHLRFTDIVRFLNEGDILVLNNSRVIPARMRARKLPSGGSVEVLLVEEVGLNDWWAMLRPGKRVRVGIVLYFNDVTGEETSVLCEVLEKSSEGHYRLRFLGSEDIKSKLESLGEIPLPPYIDRPAGLEGMDPVRYQTVFAQPPGSVAAPTAGLHFTDRLLERIRGCGVRTVEVTLHVGLGTFLPVKAKNIAEHHMHEERFEVSADAAEEINRARAGGGRVICVGTTSLRVIESLAAKNGRITPGKDRTDIFIHPPYDFKMASALVTNFHLPESTLLMLVSAFASPGSTAGREVMLNLYKEAVREKYRFFSYGDAMLIL